MEESQHSSQSPRSNPSLPQLDNEDGLLTGEEPLPSPAPSPIQDTLPTSEVTASSDLPEHTVSTSLDGPSVHPINANDVEQPDLPLEAKDPWPSISDSTVPAQIDNGSSEMQAPEPIDQPQPAELEIFPTESTSTAFEMRSADTTLDWMNAGSPLQAADQEPVTALGHLSTDPLLELNDQGDTLQPASDPALPHPQLDLPSVDVDPVQLPVDDDLAPSTLENDLSWTSEVDESAPSIPWELGQDTNLNASVEPAELDDSTQPDFPIFASELEDQINPFDALDNDIQLNNDNGFDNGNVFGNDNGFDNDNGFNNDNDFDNDAPADHIEDAWAKAFADPDSGLDDSWNAAFGQGFEDEDGFLEEEPFPKYTTHDTSSSASVTQPGPTAANPFPPVRTSSIGGSSSSYTATSPVQSNVRETSASSGPMQFFAELPTTQSVRSRKSKPQPMPQSPPSVPPPPPSKNTQPPPPQPSAPPAPPGPGGNYSQFQRPETLALFPAQPSVPVSSYAPPAAGVSPSSPPPPSIQPSSTAARYSPAPTASAQTSRDAVPPPQSTSRYAAVPSHPLPSQTAPPMPQPSSQPPYAAPSSSHPVSRQSSYAKPQMPANPPSSSMPPSSASAPSPYAPNTSTTPAGSTGPPPSTGSPLPPPPANRFAPRTSSPLAFSSSRSVQEANNLNPSSLQAATATVRYSPADDSRPSQDPLIQPGGSAQPVASASAMPERQPSFNDIPASAMSQRIRTSSPASVPPIPSDQITSPVGVSSPVQLSNSSTAVPTHIHRQPPEDLDFVLPADETSQDPLERWKGSAIFCWGPAGAAVSCIPKHVPRYGGGQAAPKMKPTAGEVKIQRLKDLLMSEDQLPPFPGPLKSKAKKKDLVSWLSNAIALFERQLQSNQAPSLQSEEKILLWKMVKILIENDGLLTGSPTVESTVREVLVQGIKTASSAPDDSAQQASPISSVKSNPADVTQIRQFLLEGNREKAIWHAVDNQLWAHAMLLSASTHPNIWKQVVQEFVRKEVRNVGQDNQSLAALYQVIAGNWDESIDELVPLSARSGFRMVSTGVTPSQTRDAFDGLNKWRETLSLTLGNRSSDDEKAVLALGKLLAASGRTEASHVCFLFARGFGYFGGYDDPNTNFTLLGLSSSAFWSSGTIDIDSINLSEAYEFGLSLSSSSSSYYAPHLQAYKLQHAYFLAESGYREEALQYCDAIASAMKSTTRLSPYCHSTLALQLDDLQKRLSQSPKDSSSWMSRPSIGKFSSSMGTWFNSFVAGDDAETASTGSGHQSEFEHGPFARISGDTPIISRSASTVDLYGAANYGKVGSQPPSNSKYAPSAYAQRPAAGDDVGTYGFSSPFTGSPEQKVSYSPRQPGDAFAHSHGSPPKPSNLGRYSPQVTQHRSYSPQGRPDSSSSRPSYEPYVPMVPEVPQGNPYAPNLETQEEQTPVQPTYDSYMPVMGKVNGSAAPNGFPSYEPPQAVDDGIPNSYAPPTMTQESSNGSYSAGGYAPPQSNYEPPADGGYAPPSYQPHEPEVPVGGNDMAPKGSGMDEADDGLAMRAAEVQRQERAARDKAADEAFRAAAEADAAQDKAGKDKRSGSGWFGGIGGFFGGGRKESPGPTVYRAKLGEENSFYYDKDLKKWINKKGDSSSPSPSSASVAPPPPRGSAPPSRSVSSMPGPPTASTPSFDDGTTLKPPPSSYPVRDATSSGPPSRIGTPTSTADSLPMDATTSLTSSPAPGASGTAPPSGLPSGTPSGPPSRPATSMSNASSIDDLIGGPQARKGGTIKKGKKGQRYVDVMAK